MAPPAVLAFGVALSCAATWMLARFVNVLTAALALAGFYFYVFVYTRWLKRTTPHNIVIGGAAGAFPPLVGWAAVTNSVDLASVYLFLIIFYWTPPHFWALALLKQRDYGNAGVPMAPLVWGERETKDQMLWYTLILIPLTLLPVAFGAFGWLYFVCALALGVAAAGRRDSRPYGGVVDQGCVEALQVLAAVSRAVVRRDGAGSANLIVASMQSVTASQLSVAA